MTRLFPIMIPFEQNKRPAEVRDVGTMFVVVAIPWEMIAPHEKQAKANHSQTLERLCERGGLDATEALAVLADKPYPWASKNDWAKANADLASRVMAWIASL